MYFFLMFRVKKMVLRILTMKNFALWCCILLTETKKILKTKLMKLLNYSDMIFYKENGLSISGLKYVHLPYGPVPNNYDILFGKMAKDHIAHIDVVFENGYEKHQVIPECNTRVDLLKKEELKKLNKVYEKFKDFGFAEISEYSHNEKVYASTKQGEIISYSYASDIDI